MAQEIKMPSLGSDMDEGVLLNWTKGVGEQINEGDVIAEIETDKATVEVPATASGTIIDLIGQPGQTLKVGSVIGHVGAAGESAPASGNGASSNGGSANGSSAPAQMPAAEKQEEKPAEAQVGEGQQDAAPAAQAPAQAPADEGESAEEADGNLPGGVKASPVARKMAAERGIDLKGVKGTGPGGRIVKADVEGYQPPAKTEAPPAQTPAAKGIGAPSYGTIPSGADVEILEVPKIRTRIASRMIDSKQQIPHFYVTTEIDVEALLNLRKQINAGLDEERKVTVNDLIVKATALTLRDFPNLNTHFYGDKLARHKRIHIGIAVALPQGGLINVVARDADKVSIGTIAQQNKEMIGAAREGKVRPDDISGSTFTVSNLGAYGVEDFMAIINPPEAGILAIGAAAKVPVVKEDGTLGVGNRMKVTVSVDHRVSDGAEGAQFLLRLKEKIENPMQLLI